MAQHQTYDERRQQIIHGALLAFSEKGYLGASNMLATLQHGAMPYIPFKSNSVPDSRGSYGPKSELWSRMYHFYALNRAEFLQHYHKRSNVETTFHMIKRCFATICAV